MPATTALFAWQQFVVCIAAKLADLVGTNALDGRTGEHDEFRSLHESPRGAQHANAPTLFIST
jgi:hypothetical protein